MKRWQGEKLIFRKVETFCTNVSQIRSWTFILEQYLASKVNSRELFLRKRKNSHK